jgi:hypothetical protein
MNSQLFTKCKSAEDRKRIKEILIHSQDALDIIREALEDQYQQLMGEALRKKLYELPGWAHRQADIIGEARGIRQAIDLLTLTQGDEK